MRALTADEVLQLWDDCQGSSVAGRVLLLAAATDRGADQEELATRPLGRVTALLLRLRTALAGPVLAATAACPGCHRAVEFAAEAGALLALADKVVDEPPPLLHGGYEVAWRCTSYGDLVAVGQHPGTADADHGAAMLLDRCVLSLRREPGSTPVTVAELPDPVREALIEAMSDADPLADVLVDLQCPDCCTEFTTTLDVAAFVWAELDSRARQLLLDIDALARAYGWSETDVLALSEARRASYLRIVTEELP